MTPVRLTVHDHRRDLAGYTYVYPVVSRRAGGISVGINLNPNNACNWRCIYCQVGGLKRGAAPPLDHALLQQELTLLLQSLADGSFYRRFQVPEPFRRLCDIAISGNGEPTTLRDFASAIATVEATLADLDLPADLAKVLISNGSQIQRDEVQRGLARWGEMGGELWFKIDRATTREIRQVNRAAVTPERILANLATAAARCPVWIQTCLFAFDDRPPPEDELQAYLDFLATVRERGIPLQGVLLYGLARPSRQPEAPRLSPLPAAWLEALAQRIRALGWPVRVTP